MARLARSHYPVFHQIEGVRLFGADELCARGLKPDVGLFEKGAETPTKQPQHTQAAASLVEQDLKQSMASAEFGTYCTWVCNSGALHVY
jgi:hypothetical protein